MQISRILDSNPLTARVFRGCFPSDRLPNSKNMHHPSGLVVNMDPHGMEGSHWVAMYIEGNGNELSYFDSLCLQPPPYLEQFMNAFPQRKRNQKSYQSPFANTCGHYCSCFLYFMSSGYSFPKFLQMLDANSSSDLFVKFVVNKMIRC